MCKGNCSNFSLKLTSARWEDLKPAIEILVRAEPMPIAHEVRDGWLYLLWSAKGMPDGITLFKPEVDQIYKLVKEWLYKQKPAGQEPDTDGSVEDNGFEIESVKSGWEYITFRVRKVFAVYAK